MRIATITNWAYGITVGLTLASGSAMLMASSADRVERQAVQQRQVFDTLSDEVENDAWALSDLARLYVVKPSPETPAARSWRYSRMVCGSPMSFRMNSRRP